jgi:hypothetical protein
LLTKIKKENKPLISLVQVEILEIVLGSLPKNGIAHRAFVANKCE